MTITRSPSQRASRLAAVFGILTALTWCLIVFGATVRAHGAGLACPDWPLCFGEVLPQLDFQVFLEWGHRKFAAAISFGLVIATVVLRRQADLWAQMRSLILTAFAVLAIQVVLGGMTVLHLLASWSVTSHLLAGNLFAATLLMCALRLRELAGHRTHPGVSRPGLWLGGAFLALLVAQLALGGLVASQYAGMACTTWPTCVGDLWFPSFQGPMGLHLVHRLNGYALFAVALGLMAVTWRVPVLGPKARVLAGLVLAQVGLGVANVLLVLPPEITAAHTGTAALLVLLTASFLRDARRGLAATGALDRPGPIVIEAAA